MPIAEHWDKSIDYGRLFIRQFMILASTKHLYQAITVSQKKTRLSQNIPHPTVHDMKEKRKKKLAKNIIVTIQMSI